MSKPQSSEMSRRSFVALSSTLLASSALIHAGSNDNPAQKELLPPVKGLSVGFVENTSIIGSESIISPPDVSLTPVVISGKTDETIQGLEIRTPHHIEDAVLDIHEPVQVKIYGALPSREVWLGSQLQELSIKTLPYFPGLKPKEPLTFDAWFFKNQDPPEFGSPSGFHMMAHPKLGLSFEVEILTENKRQRGLLHFSDSSDFAPLQRGIYCICPHTLQGVPKWNDLILRASDEENLGGKYHLYTKSGYPVEFPYLLMVIDQPL